MCRLCQNDDESVEHIVNKCEAISRTCDIEDVYSMEKDMVVMVVTRMKEFIKLSEEKEKSDSAVVQEVTD